MNMSKNDRKLLKNEKIELVVVFLIPEIVFTGRNEASDEKEKMEWMDRSVIVRLPAGRLWGADRD